MLNEAPARLGPEVSGLPGVVAGKRTLWSQAEEASTDWGEFKVAPSRGLSPTLQELAFAGGAHAYRFAMRHETGLDDFAEQVCGWICYKAEQDFLNPRSYAPTFDGGHIASGAGRMVQGDVVGGGTEVVQYGVRAAEDAANWFEGLF